MKIAMRVFVFAAVVGAAALTSEKMGQPLPFPMPPAQISQSGNMGQPLPFPMPPASLEKV